MDPVDETHPVAAGAHDERVRPRAVGEEPDAAEELAVRDAGRDDDHLFGREVVDREDPLDVFDPVFTGVLDLRAAREVPGVEDVELELTFEPPWTPDRMSDDAKFILGFG